MVCLVNSCRNKLRGKGAINCSNWNKFDVNFGPRPTKIGNTEMPMGMFTFLPNCSVFFVHFQQFLDKELICIAFEVIKTISPTSFIIIN